MDFTEKLIQCGYERVDRVETKGQFSIRGGIIDLFPPISALPFRIELFDEEIDSIRTFNSETQRSIDKVKTNRNISCKRNNTNPGKNTK